MKKFDLNISNFPYLDLRQPPIDLENQGYTVCLVGPTPELEPRT